MMKLGIIGVSEGNGHPYSWSAIVNGRYDEQEMNNCGYQVICNYLRANRDTLGIDGAQVTGIWTQEKSLSEKIAAASCIDHVVDNMDDLIGQVDAVLLARDDPENHVAMAKPFLDANVPIFIDKPLAATQDDLDYFTQQHEAGKFFMSCSSMRYATESRSIKQNIAALGPVEFAVAVGKKDWIKYGVHMLEGLYALLDDPKAVSVTNIGKDNKNIVTVEFENGILATIHLFYDMCPTFQISVFGRDGWQSAQYINWYAMFRDNLIAFIRSVRQGKPQLEFEKTKNIIRTVIAGRQSLEQNGKTIILD